MSVQVSTEFIHSANKHVEFDCVQRHRQKSDMVLALKELTVQEAAADGKCNVLRSTELSHDGRACNIGTCNYTAKRERKQSDKYHSGSPAIPPNKRCPSVSRGWESEASAPPVCSTSHYPMGCDHCPPHWHSFVTINTLFSFLKDPKHKSTTSSGHQPKKWVQFHHRLG